MAGTGGALWWDMNGKATDGKIVITRKEVARRMGNGGGCPFKYIYDVTGHDGPELCGIEMLSIARRKAK